VLVPVSVNLDCCNQYKNKMPSTKPTFSARQAAQILGISLATLYAYVSRGLLVSMVADGKRSKTYAQDEVLRLAARNADSRRAGHTAQAAIDWGVPILESRISLIADGKLRYRGHDVVQLAKSASLEQAALLLWDQPKRNVFEIESPATPHYWNALNTALANQSALNRAMSMLAALAPSDAGRTAEATGTGAQLMRLLASALLGTPILDLALHQQLAQAWQLPAQTAQAVRAALVICADHELNVSTFAVRCVISSGAELSAALSAGLAALSGPKHGRESLRVGRFLREALALPDSQLQDYLQLCLQQVLPHSGFSSGLPGFGHPLYPGGDPRGKFLLSLLPAQDQPRFEQLQALASALSGQQPNLDFGLAALEYCFALPLGAAQIIFALGRSAGWIAHAAEQIEYGQLIRPRARYVGNFEFTD
jgi:citrate synthase